MMGLLVVLIEKTNKTYISVTGNLHQKNAGFFFAGFILLAVRIYCLGEFQAFEQAWITLQLKPKALVRFNEGYDRFEGLT